MSVPRRTFFAIAGGAFVGSAAPVAAQSDSLVPVRASVRSAVGASLEGSQIEFFSPERTEGYRAYIENDSFEIELPANTSYQITYFDQTESGGYKKTPNDVPVLYGLEDDVQVGDEETDLGSYEIPEGFTVDVRFEDMDGNPVRDLPISFRASTGSGMGPGHLQTDANGRVAFSGVDPGVELSGPTGVDIHPMYGDTSPTQVDRITVTEDDEITIPIRDPEQYGGVIESGSTTDSDGADGSTDSGTDETESDEGGSESDGTTQRQTTATADGTGDESHRGFFTNDPESSIAFLNDPVRLTWAGIAVSIVGIVTQLLGQQS